MARRKRKSFGSPSVHHRGQARALAHEFRHVVGVLRENLDRGECARAFTRLKILHRYEGEFTAHRAATAKASFPRSGGMSKQLEPLARKFLHLCVR